MIVLVCGGRDYRKTNELFRVLDEIHAAKKCTILVEGDASGADRRSGDWAKDRGVQLIKVPANWTGQGLKAGTKRNKLMLDLFPIELVVAFPGGTGTANMMRQSFDRKIPIIDTEDWVRDHPTIGGTGMF